MKGLLCALLCTGTLRDMRGKCDTHRNIRRSGGKCMFQEVLWGLGKEGELEGGWSLGDSRGS